MKKNGFTLIEMLVTLSILSILFLLTVPVQSELLGKQQEEQFIETLKQDVLFIQNQSSKHTRDEMYIRFYDNHYSILSGVNKPFAERDYPADWTLVANNQTRLLRFVQSGTVLQPRTLVMYTPSEKLFIVFPLGKGRFYIEKEKRVLDD